MTPLLRLYVVLAGVSLCGAMAGVRLEAQSQGGVIAGTVADRSGGALADAVVELAGPGPTVTAHTGDDGLYRFVNVEPGTYRLTVSKAGFSPVSRDGLAVGAGERLSVAVILDIEGAAQTVDVVALRRPGRSRVSFTHDELSLIPGAGTPAALLPSVAGVVADRVDVSGSESLQQPQFVFRGSRMLDTAWSIDGVVITDRQTGSPPGLYDLEAFAEVQFAPASGDITRPGNGLGVNMVVRSGTNEVRATARGSFSGAGLQASNVRDDLREAPFFVTPDRADHTRQIGAYGADGGGPLVRGRVWFHASASRQDVRVFRQAAGDERTILAPRAIKVNWQATGRDMIDWLWVDQSIERVGVNPSPFRAPATARQHQSSFHPPNPFHGLWKIQERRIVSPALSISARYAYYGTGFQNISLGTGQAGISARLGETVGATSSLWSLRPQHTLALDGSYFRRIWGRNHELTFGAGWQRQDMFNRSLWPGDGVVAFDISPSDRRARIYREQAGRNRLLFIHGYLSDTLSLGRVTVDLGLRYDHQRGEALPSSPAGNPAFPSLVPGIQFGGHPAGASMDLSPRATVTYALTPGGRSVLRASAGRYASQFPIAIAAQGNPANAIAWIEYPWDDLNGDRLTQPNEVRVDLPYLAFEGFNPASPAAAVSSTTTSANLRSRIMTDLSLGFEREFGRGTSVTVGYHYARHTRWPQAMWRGLTPDDYPVVRTLSGTLPGGEVVSVPLHEPDPQAIDENGNARIIDTDESYYSTYHGLDASFVKRLSDGWMFGATAAWNNSRSFYTGSRPVNSLGNPTRLDGATGGGPLSAPRDPLVNGGQVAPATLAVGGGGTVFLNARWQVSLKAAYLLPWGVEAAGSLFGRQGTPSPYVIPQRLGLDGNRTVLMSPKIDSLRLDDVWNLDVRLGKRFHYRRLTVQALADAFNVLNGNAALARERNLRSPNFGRVNMTVSPRILRLGLRLSY